MEIFEQLGIDPTLILVNILGFLILVWILKKFLFGPITIMLNHREHEIKSSYAAADEEKTRSEELRQNYEARIAAVETEVHDRIQSAIKEAQGLRDDIVADARLKSEHIIKRGGEELEREREKTLLSLRQDVADMVISTSSKLLQESLDTERHRKLIDDCISSIGKVE